MIGRTGSQRRGAGRDGGRVDLDPFLLPLFVLTRRACDRTGATAGWRGDVAATSKRALRAGERLDGEGGYTVYGKPIPAVDALAADALPIGLAHDMVLKRDVPAGHVLRWSDVDDHAGREAVTVRRQMEAMFRGEGGRAVA